MRAQQQSVNRESPWLSARDFARHLRKGPTPAEALLWEMLRSKGLGVGCRRQKRLLKDRYIVDFYVPRWKLVIEIDGSVHEDPFVRDRDQRKEAELKAARFRVLRLSNEEILANVRAAFMRIIAFQAEHDSGNGIAPHA